MRSWSKAWSFERTFQTTLSAALRTDLKKQSRWTAATHGLAKEEQPQVGQL
jgi:hypothetical protein